MPERVVETRSRRLRVLRAEEAAAAGTTPVGQVRERMQPKPPWIRMKMPAGEVFFDLRKRVRRAGPAHGLRERVVPQHRRVLEPRSR